MIYISVFLIYIFIYYFCNKVTDAVIRCLKSVTIILSWSVQTINCTTHARVTGSFTPGERSSMKIFTVVEGTTTVAKRAIPKTAEMVIIPHGVKEIEAGAFAGFKVLKAIVIPDSVTSIGVAAFKGCKELKYVTIPEGIKRIEKYVFYGCTSLTYLTIPDSVTSIGYQAFFCCPKLTGVAIPDSVRSIEELAFAGDANLYINKISEDVAIGMNAFAGCPHVKGSVPTV